MQGVPLGLTLGSIPFILKSQASYTEVGFFSLAAYPYSMKLLWSPIVDTVYSSKIGLRKSWILPIQMISGLLMVFSGKTADKWLETANIRAISILFFISVLLAATQDIAVDGWALTLLSRKNVGHASTCQTIGINSGYFLSFTIFLALNDANFCNNYIRSAKQEKGILSLSNYFQFWGWIYIIITILLIFKPEKPYQNTAATRSSATGLVGVAAEGLYRESRLMDDYESSNGSLDHGRVLYSSRWKKWGHGNPEHNMAGTMGLTRVKHMYGKLWAVASLPNIRKLTTVLLICKLGSVTAEAAGVFKLMEKGVTRETISLVVLIEFPMELVFAIFAGRWASRGRPFSPWLSGYFIRMTMAIITTLLVAKFPSGATLNSAPLFYLAIVIVGVITSFASTLMFVSQGTFFARISDSTMGGTYLTLLNTIANFGYAWPKFFVFMLIDLLTTQKCVGADSLSVEFSPLCPKKGRPGVTNFCMASGGMCIMTVDGFYRLSFSMVPIGFIIGLWCKKRLRELEFAKDDAWWV